MRKWYPVSVAITPKIDLRDIWVGIYWDFNQEKNEWWSLDIYICVLPCLPLFIGFYRGTK